MITRVCKKKNDTRYNELTKKSNRSKNCYVFFQFIFQAILLMFPAFPLYFVFKHKQDYIPAWYFVGVGIAVFGIIMEAVSDQQLYNFIQEKIQKKKESQQDSKFYIFYFIQIIQINMKKFWKIKMKKTMKLK